MITHIGIILHDLLISSGYKKYCIATLVVELIV